VAAVSSWRAGCPPRSLKAGALHHPTSSPQFLEALPGADSLLIEDQLHQRLVRDRESMSEICSGIARTSSASPSRRADMSRPIDQVALFVQLRLAISPSVSDAFWIRPSTPQPGPDDPHFELHVGNAGDAGL
jgi:hypothetical protein